MRIYRSLAGLPRDFGPSALSIGNFDGRAFRPPANPAPGERDRGERGWKASVLTFDPHPTRVVAPGRTPPY
jgi:riboflavin kinase/FMN adenylyltransferase